MKKSFSAALAGRVMVPSLLAVAGLGWAGLHWSAQASEGSPAAIETPFAEKVKPFLKQNCERCHNGNVQMSGVRVDQLDAGLDERHLKLWEHVQMRISDGTMPPKGQKQPEEADRKEVVAWIARALDVARNRPLPKNGMVRRLTVSQYRNTLRELLKLDDDLTEALPPEAVSKDGFLNNKDTLQLSPLLMEAYLEMAEEALRRAVVNPAEKPKIQNFRLNLGKNINPAPLKEELILGANSLLLENADFTVEQLTAKKPFPSEPFFMRTKYRFIEGYQGNDTVRGWRDFDSIYHAVFADMRGSRGYPKGDPYNTVPEGLLLRPAIPNDELFQNDGTYGPKANFKISLRELPDYGRFRVTVTAAKYDDALLLDKGATSRPDATGALTAKLPAQPQKVQVPAAGVYQVDVHLAERPAPPAPDSSRIREGLGGAWDMEDNGASFAVEGKPNFVPSPFGKAVSFDADADGIHVDPGPGVRVGAGDFSVTAWIHPAQLRRSGIVSFGAHGWNTGWILEIPDPRGALRLETTGPEGVANGSVQTPRGVLKAGTWQHVAAIVDRKSGEARLYINGFLTARGKVGAADLDNPKLDLRIGRVRTAMPFRGQMDEVRLYKRAISEAELQALVEPGRTFAVAPQEPPTEVHLALGNRAFSGTLQQPAFAAVRLPAGALTVGTTTTGVRDVARVVLSPLPAADPLAKRFATFEKRVPRLGVQLGLRRDCGSTFAPVGEPQQVPGTNLAKYVFEGAIRNFPSPDVEKDNVNYLAGVREIAVRSEYTDDRDMPRLLLRSVEFEGPFYDSWPPQSHTNLFVPYANKADKPGYARAILRSFATRAYRRPVTAPELASLEAVYAKSAAAGRSFEASVIDALQVVLTSPQFLFLVETSKTPAPEPVGEYELASKLSYFLWNGPPDAALLRQAAAGTLRTSLNTEVARLLRDPKADRFFQQFTSQWLSLDKFAVLEPDRKQFPELNRHVRSQLAAEPVAFVTHLVRNNLPVSNLIRSDFVMANEAVATYYGFGDRVESGLRYVPVAHRRKDLGGVLTQPAILAGLSDGRESNPVKRGAWVARKIIAEPPADPPPNVPALKDDPSQKLTLRQRIERHRNQPGCVQCHTMIDPWGVALEQYDASGRWKKEPADASSTLPDKTEVSGIDDLRRYLAEDRLDQVAFSVLKHLGTYGTGRTLSYNELNFLKQDAKKLRASGYRMQDLVRYIVTSKLFLEK